MPIRIEIYQIESTILELVSSRNRAVGKILTIHHRVINMEVGNRLIILAGKHMEKAPDLILLDTGVDFFELPLRYNEEITVGCGKICAGETEFVLTEMKGKSFDIPVLKNFSEPYSEYYNPEKWIRRNGSSSPLYNAYFHIKDDTVLGKYFAETIRKIKEELPDYSPEELADAAMTLCGVGIGFTPSADDFIAGLWLVLYCCFPYIRKKLEFLSEKTFQKTVKISAYMINNAAKGRARSSEINLLNALLDNNCGKAEKYLWQVRNFGHSSGTETLIGILTGICYVEQYYIKKRG